MDVKENNKKKLYTIIFYKEITLDEQNYMKHDNFITIGKILILI